LRIAFAGTPSFALPTLVALAASPHPLVGVLTQPDRPSGRGRRLSASPVKLAAEERGLPIAQPSTLRTEEGIAPLRAWRPDTLVVVAYGLILPPTVLTLPPLGCINVHASLLPRWRGAAPIARAVLAGDSETGVTIMKMDEGLDTGPILLQRMLPIDRTATTATLQTLLATLGAEALLEALAHIVSGTAQPRAQPAQGVTYAAKLDKAEAVIDWRSSALAIERQVRAFDPWPVAETRWAGEPLRILAAEARGSEPLPSSTPPGPSAADVGTVVAVEREAILVACGEGLLAITALQRPGRKRLSASEFANAGLISRGDRFG
jgi:methionyl-tRNA formyltransferase